MLCFDLGWCTLEQRQIDSRLTALFKIIRGRLLLQTSLSSEYLSFFSRTIIHWNNLPASVFSKHCTLDTFKAHISCLNHLPVYQPIKVTFFVLFLFCWLTQPIILECEGLAVNGKYKCTCLIMSFILIITQFYREPILQGEISFWSLLFKWLMSPARTNLRCSK